MSDREKRHSKNMTAKNAAVNNFTKKINSISFNYNGKISNSKKFDERKSDSKNSNDRNLTQKNKQQKFFAEKSFGNRSGMESSMEKFDIEKSNGSSPMAKAEVLKTLTTMNVLVHL